MNVALLQILAIAIGLYVPAFAVVAAVLFFLDGAAARREGRPRKKRYVVMFVLGVSLVALLATLVLAIGYFLSVAMRNVV